MHGPFHQDFGQNLSSKFVLVQVPSCLITKVYFYKYVKKFCCMTFSMKEKLLSTEKFLLIRCVVTLITFKNNNNSLYMFSSLSSLSWAYRKVSGSC